MPMRARAVSGGRPDIDWRAQTPAPRSTSKGGQNLRKLWLNLHLGLALALGFLFVLMGLTGSCNVFTDELDEVFNPDLVIQAPGCEL